MAEPHASYLVTLVAGRVRAARPTRPGSASRDVPLAYLVPQGREEDGRRAFARTPQMIEHFSEITGVPYPWNGYAQIVVADFIFGGMENTTATTMYEHVLLDERAALDVSSDDLVAHELAHQWFGDYVTCRAWYEGWLNEGFATFFEHVWREKHLGRDEYAFGLKSDLEAYVTRRTAATGAPSSARTTTRRSISFDRHLYEKGGLVLHALRSELGDALFWRGRPLVPHEARARRRRDARPAARARGGERSQPGAALRAVGLQARAPRDRGRARRGRRGS